MTVTGHVPRKSVVGLITMTAEGINGVKNVDVSGVTFDEAVSSPAQPAPGTPQATVTKIAPTTIAPTTGNMNASAGSTDMDAEIKQVEDRSRVAKAVLSAIRSNGELADDPIDVLQSGSSVILRGVVDNDHEKRLLEQVARGVNGVSGVDISGVRVAQGARELVKEKDQDSGDTVYTVKPGDSLSAIAQKFYGDPMEYKKIAHYNNISNPDLIHPGDRLRIPG